MSNRRPVVTFGETMMLLATPTVGALQHAESMTVRIGGAESNVAIGLQRLGVPTVWMSKLGADSAGDLVEREIRAEGVTVIAFRDAGAPTGLMLKERRTPTSTRVSYYRAGSAASRATSADLDEHVIRSAALLHLTGITPALSASAAELALHAARTAKDAGVRVSFDLNYRSTLWSTDSAHEFYAAILPLVDVLFAGDDEAAIALGHTAEPAQLARELAGRGPSEVVIKLGSRGALTLAHGEVTSCDAVRIDPVDTVGAGDAFVAGYLAELLAGAPVVQRLDTAVAVGAFACLSPGDWEGAPRRDELHLLNPDDPVAR
ncbi:sugar kinase [Microbacterium marmarense]|uniref:Sugar kinase n=1 Tax=Microbacterium marmarense TaxID=3122051 RepID=A0ABU8LSD1_9MICO